MLVAARKRAAVPGTAALEVLLRSRTGFGAWRDELGRYLIVMSGRTINGFWCINGFTTSFLLFFTGFAFAIFQCSFLP
jgi:hypothetical protein